MNMVATYLILKKEMQKGFPILITTNMIIHTAALILY